ncbi:unnamed protein product [Absidia cylindrospora]
MPGRNPINNSQHTTASPNTASTPTSAQPGDGQYRITSADISGPFYSISDVLNDSPTASAAAGAAAAAAATVGMSGGDVKSSQTRSNSMRGTKRNVLENEVVATSGGSNLKGLNRRASMNPFSRQRNMKPSPLESVVSKTRPRMLPPKNPVEEKKHLQQHDAMMKKAQKLEAKKQKEHDKKKEETDRKMAQSVNTWEKTILPHWSQKIKEKKVQELWLQGIPPRCRRKVWILAIGNNLNLSKESFATCVRRLPPIKRSSQDTKPKYTQDSLSPDERKAVENGGAQYTDGTMQTHQDIVSEDSSLFYQQLIGKRTSSLNVLNDMDDDNKYNNFDDEPLTPRSTSSSHSNEFNDGNEELQPQTYNDKRLQRYSDDSISDTMDNATNGRPSADSKDSMELGDDQDDDDDDDRDDDHAADENSDTMDDTNYDASTIAFLHKAVDEDIIRTLPSLCVFQPDGPMFLSLRKVLQAYIGYRSDLQYIRGASFLAGMLLLNMGTYDAFLSLSNLIHNSPVLAALYNSDEARVKGYFKVFNVIFAEHMPKLYLHFKNLSLTPDNYLPDWLMTLFSSIIPLGLSSRLWDIFLLEGDMILFKTGLVVLKYLEPLLWGGGFSETVRILNMGFIGEHRGEEAKAAVAVSGDITKGEQDQFFEDILGRNSIIQLDSTKYAKLISTHIPK